MKYKCLSKLNEIIKSNKDKNQLLTQQLYVIYKKYSKEYCDVSHVNQT